MSIHSLNTYTPRATAEPPSTARLVCRQLMDLELEDLRSGALWKAVVAEFIGCFFLVYFGVGAGLCGPDEPPPSLVEVTLSAGFFIAAILTALTAVSGAHVNPAVSLGFLVARQCSFVRFVFYVIAQSAGSITGAALLRAVTPESKIGNLGLLLPPPDVTTEQALMAEFMITFLLLFCIIAMVDSGRSDVKGSVPFIVGLVVCVNIFYAANISGGSMNPIRNLGPAVIQGNMDKQWIYWVGPLVGGAAGSLLYDRVLSVARTPADLRRSCLSRGPAESCDTDLDRQAGVREPLMEAGPLPAKPTSRMVGSLERVDTGSEC
ncbi:hypothetical protein BaRGS_00027803 [Batillaria attramentaria]|uniref:Aquaporin n=1 Tax=Batillaria attramentaria TaxID=370345 RepID=A0ABD0K2A9_9CAEN